MFSGENIPIDLNNPKNVWNINKFCENKSEYLVYHTKVAAAFKQDCENLLLAFAAREDLTFESFAEVWQQLSFSLVFVGQEFFDELPVFAESCFFIIKKYIMFSTNIYIQVGAFYLLYGIYAKQLSKDVVQIRMTLEEYAALMKLVERMHRNLNTEDFAYTFRHLKHSQAFQFVSTTRCLGLEPKFTWQEKKMKNNVFQHTLDSSPFTMLESILFSDDNYNLINLNKICCEYDNAMKEYAGELGTIKTKFKNILPQIKNTHWEYVFRQLSYHHQPKLIIRLLVSPDDGSLAAEICIPTNTSCKPLAIHRESHVVQKVEALFDQLQEELGPPNSVTESRAVAQKKKAIRDKAFCTIQK